MDDFSGPNEYETARDHNNYAGRIDTVRDPFWTEDISILFKHTRLREFVPSKDMTRKEKLNAITRFFLYLGFILTLYTGDTWPVYMVIFGMAFTLFLFKGASEFRDKTDEEIADPDAEIQHTKPLFTTDVDRDRGFENRQGCTAPTPDNPFMNVLVNEIHDNPIRPPACNYAKVKSGIDENFYHNLYQDVGDAVWNKNNSQRQFFTMPSTTIPNDQTSYANWLYGIPPGSVCKESSENCMRYEDLRANRPIVGTNEYIV